MEKKNIFNNLIINSNETKWKMKHAKINYSFFNPFINDHDELIKSYRPP